MSCLVPLRSSKSLRGSDVLLEGLPCVVCDVTMHGLSNGVKVSRLCHLTRVVRSEKAMAPTPVLLPGESHGQRSLVGCSPWGR